MSTITKISLLIVSVIVMISSVNAADVNGLIGENDGSKIVKTSNTNNGVFEIIPNDGNEKLTVKFNIEANVSSIKLIDNQSSVVFEGARSRGASNVLDIPIEDMEPGTYFIRVQTEDGVKVERIIISK